MKDYKSTIVLIGILLLGVSFFAWSKDIFAPNESREPKVVQEDLIIAKSTLELFKLEEVLKGEIRVFPDGRKALIGEPVISPDGTKLAISLKNSIVIVDSKKGVVATSATMGLSELGITRPRRADWDLTGERILFTCRIKKECKRGWVQGFCIYSLADNSLSLVKQFEEDTGGGNPDLSSDGTCIAYHRIVNGKPTIWMIDLKSGNEVQITEEYGATPRWSHNGQLLCYLKYREPWVYDLRAREHRKLYPRTTTLFPQFSPCDGFLCFIAEKGQLAIVSVDGKQVTKLKVDINVESGLFGGISHPVWSPDGKRIAFRFATSTKDDLFGSSDIYTINIEGSDLRQITFSPEIFKRDLQWIDEETIVYTQR
jgi:tricorn protease-like protein